MTIAAPDLPQYFYGHNNGNTTCVGVAWKDGQEIGKNIFLNLSAPGTLSRQKSKKDMVDAAGRNQKTSAPSKYPFDTKEYALTFDGFTTIHGEHAFGMKDSGSALGDIHRYGSRRWNLRNLLVCAGSILEDDAFELWVGTHLPVGSYNAENRMGVIGALQGDHTFTLNKKQRRAIVHVSAVRPEGAGAMVKLGLPGMVKQGIVDIGGYSTDLYVAIGQKPYPPLCFNLSAGVERIGELINEQVDERFSGHSLDNASISAILMASVGVGVYPELYYRGTEITAIMQQEWYRVGRHLAAEEINRFISANWKTGEFGGIADDFAKISLIGGGQLHFRDTVLDRLPNLNIPGDPEYIDTIGYAMIAEQLGYIEIPVSAGK